MTPEQFEIFLKRNDEATQVGIEKHVNGKIRILDEKLSQHIATENVFRDSISAHMEEVKPFLQGARGLKTVRDFFIWVGGLFVVYVAFRNSIKF